MKVQWLNREAELVCNVSFQQDVARALAALELCL